MNKPIPEDDGRKKKQVGRPKKRKPGRPKKKVELETSCSELEVSLASNANEEEQASFTSNSAENDVSLSSNADEQEASSKKDKAQNEVGINKEGREEINGKNFDEEKVVGSPEEKENELNTTNTETVTSPEDEKSAKKTTKRKIGRPRKEVTTPKEKSEGPARKVGRPRKKPSSSESSCSRNGMDVEEQSTSPVLTPEMISRGRNMFTRNHLRQQKANWKRSSKEKGYFEEEHLKMMEGQRVNLTEVNPYLVCVLCQGYLIDAVTIVECLHSFCRSCIFRHLDKELLCPKCETVMPNTKLFRHIRPDKTLQDIVYKVVPGLFHSEMQRRRDFYKDHPNRDEHLAPECRGINNDRWILSPVDGVSLSIEFYDDEREKEEWSNNDSPNKLQFGPPGPKRYLQCPAGFKIAHLKKFIRQKYGLSNICNIDILYRRECIPDSYSLMDIAYIYTWKRNKPMRFYFRMPEALMKQLLSAFCPPPPVKEIKEINGGETLPTTVKSIDYKPDANNEEENKENGEDVAMEVTPNVNHVTDKDKAEEQETDITKEKTDEQKTIDVKQKTEDSEQNTEGSEPNTEDSEQKTEDAKQNTEDAKQKTCDLKQKTEDSKSKIEDGTSLQGNLIPRPLSKQDELSVSVLLSLGQHCVEKKEDYKFLVPQPITPKNDISEKRTKVSPRPSVNKIASDLAENKAQLTKSIAPTSPIALINSSPSTQNQQLGILTQRLQQLRPTQPQQQKKLQPVQKQQQIQKQGKNQFIQQKQQHILQQKHQMQQLMHQQQIQQLQQQHLQLQQQQFMPKQQFHQLHFHQLQQFQQLQAQQPLILQIQQQPQAVHQINETKPQPQPANEPQQQVSNQTLLMSKAPQTSPMPKSPHSNCQKTVSQNETIQQTVQHLQSPQQQLQMHNQHQQMQQRKQQQRVQQQQMQKQLVEQQQMQKQLVEQQQMQKQLVEQQQMQKQLVEQQQMQKTQLQKEVQEQQMTMQQPHHQIPKQQVQEHQKQQHEMQQQTKEQESLKARSEPSVAEKSPLNGNTSVQSPQVTLNTSKGSVTIMAQLKSPTIASSPLGVVASNPSSPPPTMNGNTSDTPRPQGIHQNLPRTVLPQAAFVNGKTVPKSIQQKNLSGQRLNSNVPEAKNGLIQQSNINNRLPTFQKNSRKVGSPGGVAKKNGQTLDQRIQKLFNGPTNKPPSPGGKSESRLASWLTYKFPSPTKEEAEMTPSLAPKTPKEANTQRYKRKLQDMQKVQEICEITQENPRPDDAKRRREVTPDVSIELMRAADMKKLEPVTTKRGEKRPMPGLKSLQELNAKRKKEEDSALDLRKAGDLASPPQLPWLTPRPPPHFVPRQT